MDNNITTAWQEYQNGIEFKRRIDYYNTIDENYRYFQGDQWGDTKSEGLPTPVFNVIKPVIRYKISTIMQNDTKIVFSAENKSDREYPYFNEVAELLSRYCETLWEKLKMDFYNEKLLQDASVSGNGFSYFFIDDETGEIKMELIDGTNVYPANPNLPDIQEQKYITIALRRSCEDVREEAKAFGFSDTGLISPDTDTSEIAGDSGKIELRDSDMCIVLLKMWRDKKTGTIHYSKSTKSCEYVKDIDLKMKRYPIAMLTWENKKNCFFGLSDVTGLIPNQDYINTIAAMIMASTTFTAFPKMVYNEDYVDNPNNGIGTAIGVCGSDMPINDVISYIAPKSTSADVFNMFDRTIELTKDLMGANENALGEIDVSTASGKAIMAAMEQSSMPLESVKRRFYNYLEDVALIWAELWKCSTKGTREVTVKDENGEYKVYCISSKAFDKIMLDTKVEVGPATRWSEVSLLKTLENLLTGGYISFEWYVNLLPENSGVPKAKILELIENAKRENIENQYVLPEPETKSNILPDEQNSIDTDEFVNSIESYDEAEKYISNPEMLEEIFMKKLTGER